MMKKERKSQSEKKNKNEKKKTFEEICKIMKKMMRFSLTTFFLVEIKVYFTSFCATKEKIVKKRIF